LLTDAVGCPQDNAWTLPLAKEGSCPPCPAHVTHAETCRARQDGEGGLLLLHGRPVCPSPTDPRRSCPAGRTRAAADAVGHSPAESESARARRTRCPQSRRCTAEGKETQLQREGRQEGPQFPGVAAPQCLSSSNGRVKVFALGLIIKDTWVLLSHALFFFFF